MHFYYIRLNTSKLKKNIMKKNIFIRVLYVLFPLCITIFSCHEEEEAKLITSQKESSIEKLNLRELYDEDNNKITTESIKNLWEQELWEEGVSANLSEFELLTTEDEKGEALYFLKAISDDKTIETGAFIYMMDSGHFKLGKKKCSCTGCPSGCHLTTTGGQCNCTPCFPPGDNQKCEKKEETTIENPEEGMDPDPGFG